MTLYIVTYFIQTRMTAKVAPSTGYLLGPASKCISSNIPLEMLDILLNLLLTIKFAWQSRSSLGGFLQGHNKSAIVDVNT